MVRAYDKLGLTDLRDDAARVMQKNFPESRYLRGRRAQGRALVAALGSRVVRKVLVIGAAGMIGRKLVTALAHEELILHDVVPFPGASAVSDLSAPGEAEKLLASRPQLIFHLAAVVSGEAEADFDKGYRVNLEGTQRLFEAIRKENYRPRVVFTSSIAVFGAPFPEAIDDEFLSAPLTSYGTQKAIGELLLSDYSRRGFMDGIGIRLPTICVRPGKPNKAASGFFSGIIREPLAGQEAVLPVPETVRHWFASAARRRWLFASCFQDQYRAARRAAQPQHARHQRHRGRADRGAAQGRGRESRAAHPPRARCRDSAHRRGLAAQFRREARRCARLPRRPELRGHHPHSH